MIRLSRARRRDLQIQWIKFVVLVVVTFILITPILMIVVNSLKSNGEFMTSSSLLPHHITFNNYLSLNQQVPFFTFLRNSGYVSVVSTLLAIFVGSTGGYALSRFNFKWIKRYSMFLLLVQMFPVTLMLIPLFIIFKAMGIIGTEWPVIAVYVSLQLAFATWMSSGFFDSIPMDLEEAAWIDGCSRAGGIFRVVIRLAIPGLIAVAIFAFLLAWNDFFIATIFLHDTKLMTIPLGIQMFIQQYSAQWGSLMAASTLASLPVVILFLFIQRYIVKSTVAGAVKG